jgi:phage gp29-like protein
MGFQDSSIPMQAVAPESVDIYAEYGVTGLRRFGALVFEEWLPALSGQNYVRVFREMSQNDATIGAILFTIEMLARQTKWRVEPGGETPGDKEAAEHIEQCRNDMSMTWSEFITEVLSFLVFGFSFHEICYKLRKGVNIKDDDLSSAYDDGRIGWAKLPIRSQDTLWGWRFKPSGEIAAYIQLGPPDYKMREIPRAKGLLFRTKSHKGNPQGMSVLRTAYRAWYYKKTIEIIEAIGIERDLAGYPIIWLPVNIVNAAINPKSTDEEKRALIGYKNMITNIRRDQAEGAIMPLEYDNKGNKRYDLSLLGDSKGSQRASTTAETINRYKTEIAMSVMADFLTLGSGKTGSFALSKSKTALFTEAMSAYLDSIADEINNHAIPALVRLNAFKITNLPKLVHEEIESVDLKELGAFIQAIVNAGAIIFPNATLTNALLKMARLPEVAEEEPLVPEREVQDRVDMETQGLRDQLRAAQQTQAASQPEAEGETSPESNKPESEAVSEPTKPGRTGTEETNLAGRELGSTKPGQKKPNPKSSGQKKPKPGKEE